MKLNKKSNKKFPPALGGVVGQALKDYSAWMKKTVQGIPCEAIEKSGLFQEDIERCVCLTLDEAKRVQSALYELLHNSNDKNSREWLAYWMLIGRIEQAKGYTPIHGTPMEGKLILPKQVEGK